MKVLQVNKYYYRRGGTEQIFLDSVDLLRRHGHEVSVFSMKHPNNPPDADGEDFISYIDYYSGGWKAKAAQAAGVIYSREAEQKMRRLLSRGKPDVAHLHNIYHQISPSIIPVLKKAGVPIVMTLHDFKTVCPAYNLMRNGRPCEDCSGRRFYRCFLTGCLHGSRLRSLAATLEMYVHHFLWPVYRQVDLFLAPSLFLKDKIERMGFKGKVVHLPNFVSLQEYQPAFDAPERTAIFFGRLDFGKGIQTLIEAADGLEGIDVKIIGEGPARPALEEMVRRRGLRHVCFPGYLSSGPLGEEIRKALMTVLPSVYYENQPRAILESFALGKPVIAARSGGIPELVEDGQTGLLFAPGDAKTLRSQIAGLAQDDPQRRRLGENGRALVERRYSLEAHYEGLMETYERLLAARGRG